MCQKEKIYSKLVDLHKFILRIPENVVIEFIDTSEFIVSSENDPIHWSKKTHKNFGEILAKIFVKKIKP